MTSALSPSDTAAAARASVRTLLDAPPVDAIRLLPILAQAKCLTTAEDIAGTLMLCDILNEVGRHTEVLMHLGTRARKWTGIERAQAELCLAHGWQGMGNVRAARKAYETASLMAPSLDIAPALAALAQMQPTSVQTLFDVFADSFDQKLLETLGYAVPGIMDRLLMELGIGGELSILDLGCGTGLCGPALAPRAARLDGCDLSLNMLEKAVGRALYHHLWWADLLCILETNPAAWDLILAADVLLYVHDLAPVFTQTAIALRPGGRFIFTLLTCDGTDTDVERHADGHYHHGDDYIRRLIAAHGLSLRLWREIVPRYEHRQPVDGRLVVVEKV